MAQKEKSDQDEAKHMEDTLRAVAEAEEDKLSESGAISTDAETEDTRSNATLDEAPVTSSVYNPPVGELEEKPPIEATEPPLPPPPEEHIPPVPAPDELSTKESSISSLSNSLTDLILQDPASENALQSPTEETLPRYPIEPQVVGSCLAQSQTQDEDDLSMTFREEDDLPPPPDDMEDVSVSEDFPAPPPMSDISEEDKQNIARRRMLFLEKEQQAINDAQGSPTKLERVPRAKPLQHPFVQSDSDSIASSQSGMNSPQRLHPNGVSATQIGENERTFSYSNEAISDMIQNRDVVKRPPALPKRSPSTRISSIHQHSDEVYEDIIVDEHIPPPPSYPAPVPPVHNPYRQNTDYGMDRHIPPPPPTQPPPPPPPGGYHSGYYDDYSSNIYDDPLPPPLPDGNSMQQISPPPLPPPNHPLSHGYGNHAANVPAPPPPPGPPPAPSTLAQQIGYNRLRPANQNRGQRTSAPPANDNQMENMLKEIKKKQTQRRLSENSSTGEEGSRTPPATSPKPQVKVPGMRMPVSPPATKPKPTKTPGSKASQRNASEPPPAPEYEMEPLDPNIPNWKRAMIEKKRKEEMTKKQEEDQINREEAEKWKGIPAWKKNLMKKQEQKKVDDEVQQTEATKDETDLEIKLASMPEWKKKVFLKKMQKDGDENGNKPSTKAN